MDRLNSSPEIIRYIYYTYLLSVPVLSCPFVCFNTNKSSTKLHIPLFQTPSLFHPQLEKFFYSLDTIQNVTLNG